MRSLLIRLFHPEIPVLWVDKRTPERFLLTQLKINVMSKLKGKGEKSTRPGIHLLKRNVQDFSSIFNFTFTHEELASFVSQKKRTDQISSCSATYSNEVDDKIILQKYFKDEFVQKYITIVPSASFEEKRWSAAKFQQLFETILADNSKKFQNMGIVILAGPSDHFCRQFDYLEQKYPKRFKNLQGKTSIYDSAILLKYSKFCFGNDTGLPHMAETLGVPAFILLGPTGEEFGFYPHLDQSDFIGKRIWCRPCSTNGAGRCIRFKKRLCLDLIEVNDVFGFLNDMNKC